MSLWQIVTLAIGCAITSTAFGAPRTEVLDNGKLHIDLRINQGIQLTSFVDLGSKQEMLAPDGPPLWQAELRNAAGEKLIINSSQGWGEPRAFFIGYGERNWMLWWTKPTDPRLAGIEANCGVTLDDRRSTWRLSITNNSKTWSIWRVRFPQIALGKIGDENDDRLLIPQASGQLISAPLSKRVSYSGTYPSGWDSMQFFARYNGKVGLYIGMHDPWANMKDMAVEHAEKAPAITCRFDLTDRNMGKPGKNFDVQGSAVLETFTGDWFDAAQIYRAWVEKTAEWTRRDPARLDTPKWMHEIAIWAQASGSSEHVVPAVKKFAEFMGVPTAVHWYNWHQVPFDTDYPHYFPAKKGFADGVRELQKAGVRVMPYINGRLWDSGLEDFKTIALPNAAVDEKGNYYVEEYGSKRKLVPMCPATKLWQDTVNGTLLRLMSDEFGVDGVYIDQIAAAPPKLCFGQHPHGTGGGDSWARDGYWRMIGNLRKEMGRKYPEKMITTECNAEPYVHLFDGYLTWHFQHDGQVPAFAAIYGGKVQLFGRAYRGGPSKDLALRMKAGQSLVFGEQIGWIDPSIVNEPENASFLRKMARLRYALRAHLADGQMARPPKLIGEIPNVTADWQWSGVWKVTTPALLSGAWQSKEKKTVMIFVNVSDKKIATQLDLDPKVYGFDKPITITRRTEPGAGSSEKLNGPIMYKLTIPARDALVLEIQ